ncbi:hypothetical protein MKX01_028860, partial [Papaver californicum]
ASDQRKRNVEKEDKGICGETVVEKSKGVYVGVQDDIMSDLGAVAVIIMMEHSFVLKDDQGYICRICGMIEKSIEQISDFQWGKGTKTTKNNYMSQFRTVKDREQAEGSPFIIANASDQDFGAAEMSVRPTHMKQMKPHKIEGFNFLLRNLVCSSPAGCILAHTPGSGKTVMTISFMQSFLANFPMPDYL